MELHWDDLVQLPTIIDLGIIIYEDDHVSLLSAYIIFSNLDPNSSSIAHPSCSCHRERLSFPVFYSPNCAVHRPIDTVLYESPSCKKGARKLLQWVSLVIQQPSMSWAGPWPFGLLTARGFSVNSWQNHRHNRCMGKILPRLQKSWSSLSVRRG